MRRILLPCLLGAALAGAAAPSPAAPACQPRQLRLSVDGGGGDLNGMSHGGTHLSIRNLGGDCRLAALPPLDLRDAQGHALPVRLRAPSGRTAPVVIGSGHRAAMDLRWVSGPVYPDSRSVRAAEVRVRFGAASLAAPLDATMYGPAGQAVEVERTALRAMEGMASDR